MKTFLQRHLDLLFVALTFGWTWSVNLPEALAKRGIGHGHVSNGAITIGGFSPTIVALALAGFVCGMPAMIELLRKLRVTVSTFAWCLPLLLGAFAVAGSATLFYRVIAGRSPPLGPWHEPFLMALILIPFTGFFEELGWRGFLQDRLQKRFGVFRAAVVIGAVWGAWHIPMYLRLNNEGDKTPQLIVVFLAGAFPLAMIFASVYNLSGRRLLPVMVLHAAIDASIGYFFSGMPTGDLRGFIYWILITTSIAAGLWLWRPPEAQADGNVVNTLSSQAIDV
jgi:hypothetical protein